MPLMESGKLQGMGRREQGGDREGERRRNLDFFFKKSVLFESLHPYVSKDTYTFLKPEHLDIIHVTYHPSISRAQLNGL